MARGGCSDPARASICFGLPHRQDVALPGDPRFNDVLTAHYDDSALRAQEEAIALKQRAQACGAEDFWEVMCTGLADLLDAQLSFISTRVTHDRTTGNELPPIGEVGSYLNALGLYFHEPAKSVQGFSREVLYKAWDCPCSGMKHGKVFIIPSDADKFNPHNPNAQFLPFELEAYIGLPCILKGVCVGHFGVIWTKAGAARRALSWSAIESLLHSFEDMVQARIMAYIEKDSLAHWRSLPAETTSSEQRSSLDSFKPYAQILSHELRTPMQGIVGPLDLIQATIRQAAEGQLQLHGNDWAGLNEDIAAVQNSANRATDTVEKIIDAYKLDMGRPLKSVHAESAAILDATIRIPAGPRARRLSATTANPRGTKRKYVEGGYHEHVHQSQNHPREPSSPWQPSATDFDVLGLQQRQIPLLDTRVQDAPESVSEQTPAQPPNFDALEVANVSTSGLMNCNIKDMVRNVVDQSSKKNIQPKNVVDEETSIGHVLRASYRQQNGEWHHKKVAWSVAEEVPETILVRESDLERLVSLVFENALKFTASADIELKADLDISGDHIVFYVTDTGPGIRPQLQPKIFQPFTQGDTSITRSSEGTGLGLLVAKGLADKLGGDVILARSETEGKGHGSEFHIRIPITPPGLQTPTSQASAPPSVAGTATETYHRRQSSDSSHLLRTGYPPAQPTYQPFGQLSQVLITPASSTNVSPKMETLAEASEQQQAGPSQDQREQSGSCGKDEEASHPLTFLVVEDNQMIRLSIVRMLTKLGYDPSRIYQACDGADAIRQVTELHKRHAEEVRAYGSSRTPPIDLVLMDLWMPEVDGYEATKRILALYSPENALPSKTSMRRCVSEPGNVPLVNSSDGGVKTVVAAQGHAKVMIPPTIFGISADATDDASARATQVGMKAFVPKPFKLAVLEKFIEEAKLSRALARQSGP
ncbi:MAG: hypothetical protein Q9159_002496 [Coniocarpon cinnabarinum]